MYIFQEEKDMDCVEKWGVFELSFLGKCDGNPYIDYSIKAEFSNKNEQIITDGFYDGDGIYRVRFMPSFTGEYSYRVWGNCLDGEKKGSFFVTPVKEESNNHGPVKVIHEHYLAYADNMPYNSIGTTCYAWVHQPDELCSITLDTLQNSSFNKIRFCIFPKFYKYKEKEPVTYPYIRGKSVGQDEKYTKKELEVPFYTESHIEDIRDFDCTFFNTEHFKRLDYYIGKLMELGIEADLILMHPYDKWGFSTMNRECDELYLKYVTARYAAFRNVWWSMANEYDLTCKDDDRWNEYGRLVTSHDPYHHMCSIHNCIRYFDYSKEWITHCSMQRTDLYCHAELTDKYVKQYNKPVIWDEIAYEGNIDAGWGNISGQELVRRFWEASLRGGYAGHGETYVHPDDILWWSHGGKLHGESEPRLSFLKKILDETPGGYLKRGQGIFDEVVGIPYDEENEATWTTVRYCSYEIHYYGFGRPSFRDYNLPDDEEYRIEVIDTWNMTVTDTGIHHGFTRISLPQKEYVAVRLVRM